MISFMRRSFQFDIYTFSILCLSRNKYAVHTANSCVISEYSDSDPLANYVHNRDTMRYVCICSAHITLLGKSEQAINAEYVYEKENERWPANHDDDDIIIFSQSVSWSWTQDDDDYVLPKDYHNNTNTYYGVLYSYPQNSSTHSYISYQQSLKIIIKGEMVRQQKNVLPFTTQKARKKCNNILTKVLL